MQKGIGRSVGKNGHNERRDVRVVQAYINSFSAWKKKIKPLKVDGVMGKKTIHAIEQFQYQAVGMAKPDGRVDPNGKTFRYLTMYYDQQQQKAFEASVEKNAMPVAGMVISQKVIDKQAGLNAYRVSYKSSVKHGRKLVSEYARSVIKVALKESGMKTAVITSTLRTPQEQASIMLKNAKIDLAKQYRLYGRSGDSVLDVYENNKAKSDKDIIKLMVKEIDELEKSNRRVSNHCISPTGYRRKNIIDIGLNSTKSANKNFSKPRFTQALKNLVKEGYIDRLIDETAKSNQCWHIEIQPGKKDLMLYHKGSILNQTKFVNGKPA